MKTVYEKMPLTGAMDGLGFVKSMVLQVNILSNNGGKENERVLFYGIGKNKYLRTLICSG